LKGINRAIPDGQFDDFVDRFARRVGGWDRHGIATAKSLINKYSGFPTVAQWEETWEAFLVGINQVCTYKTSSRILNLLICFFVFGKEYLSKIR